MSASTATPSPGSTPGSGPPAPPRTSKSGLPGSDTPAPGRGPTRNRITVVGPLLDTDGDKHLDVVVGAPGFLDAKKRDLDAFWVLRGTGEGMRYQQHFTTSDIL